VKVFSTLELQPRKNLLVLFAAGLLFWSSLASLLPTLPLYVEDVGGTKQQIGFVMAAFAIGLLLCRPTLGKLADTRSRKLVVLIGVAVVAIAPLGYLFAKSIPALLVLRAFHGISIAAYTTGSSALIVDLSPVDKRGEVIGYMSLSNPIGMAIGPALGGFIQAQAGYPPLFLCSFALGALAFLCASFVTETSNNSTSPTDTVSIKPVSDKFWSLLASDRLKIPALVMLIVGLVFGALATFVALYIREAKIDFNAGWFYSAAAMSSFMIRLVTGKASDRYGRGMFISVSLVSYILAMFMLSVAHTPVYFLLAGFLEGGAGGTLIPIMIALLSDRSYPHERARIFALCIGGFDLGIALAGPIFGSVAEKIGYQGVFSVTSGLALLALIVFVTQNSKDLAHSLRFASGRGGDLYAVDQV
jgi:MFS family permease